MARRFVRRVILSASMIAAAIALHTPARSADDLNVVGTWLLESSVTERDGWRTEQFGHGAAGMLSLDSGGRFMLTIIGPKLPRFVSNNRAAGTAEENRAVMAQSIAMIGTYVIEPEARELVFNVDHATFPNWNGTAHPRKIVTADGEQLVYIAAVASSGGIGTVRWRRAR